MIQKIGKKNPSGMAGGDAVAGTLPGDADFPHPVDGEGAVPRETSPRSAVRIGA